MAAHAMHVKATAEENSNSSHGVRTDNASCKGDFLWPASGTIARTFHQKTRRNKNDGINIANSAGAPVRVADDGIVIYSGNELRAYGNMLLVRHLDGTITLYAHTQKLLVARGDRVVRGQRIALVGSTGHVASPQLHFEIRRGDRVLNPMKCLAASGKPKLHRGKLDRPNSRYDASDRRSMDLLVITRPN